MRHVSPSRLSVLTGILRRPWHWTVCTLEATSAVRVWPTGDQKRAILCVEATGDLVVSVVSDMGGAKLGLWKELGINHQVEGSFAIPADPQR